jgi:hypothetical protein
MEAMHRVAQTAIEMAPPACRIRPEDADVIARNNDHLASIGGEIVQGFYDTVFGHGPTAAVFKDGERGMREESLEDWWLRTINGPINDEYWAWMALVGLLHVLRQVENPMMLAMSDYVARYVADNVHRFPIDADEQLLLADAFRRHASTTSSIITYAYDHAVSSALFDVAGMPESLLRRLRDQEIVSALKDARSELRAAAE